MPRRITWCSSLLLAAAAFLAAAESADAQRISPRHGGRGYLMGGAMALDVGALNASLVAAGYPTFTSSVPSP